MRELLKPTPRTPDRVWHPYTRFSTHAETPLPMMVRGEGLHLIDADGRRWIDAISSWWCMSLGHAHPALVAAIREQAGILPHSILGNLSHPTAQQLAGELAGLMPTPDRHVLFASDGSSAIEQAMKIAVQYWHQRGAPERHRFAAIASAYHGDTLGAMSAGYLEDWHRPFRPLLQPAIPMPIGPVGAPVQHRGAADASAQPFDATQLDAHARELAAVIVEPLCLGAAGMRMYGAETLARIGDWCRRHGIPLIVDEIAMGFGRTGRMFAYEHAGIDPDIVCVGKALAAGHMPISATMVRDTIYRTFGDQPVDHTLQHGHTFCGHPISAAAALAALAIYQTPDFLPEVQRKAARLAAGLLPLADQPGVKSARCLGLLGAIELDAPTAEHGRNRARRIREWLFDHGILLRPLGPVIYLAPPLNTPDDQLDGLVTALREALRATV